MTIKMEIDTTLHMPKAGLEIRTTNSETVVIGHGGIECYFGTIQEKDNARDECSESGSHFWKCKCCLSYHSPYANVACDISYRKDEDNKTGEVQFGFMQHRSGFARIDSMDLPSYVRIVWTEDLKKTYTFSWFTPYGGYGRIDGPSKIIILEDGSKYLCRYALPNSRGFIPEEEFIQYYQFVHMKPYQFSFGPREIQEVMSYIRTPTGELAEEFVERYRKEEY